MGKLIDLKPKTHNLKTEYIIGIDEVGRGALAGPVVVAALVLPRISNIKYKIKPSEDSPKAKTKIKLKDSKKLSPKQREIWFQYIKIHPKIFYATASISPKIIDKINISAAANLAATRAFEKLITNCKIANCKIFLDGGLYLKKIRVNPRKNPRLSASTITKGDEKIPAIMLASIVAKVRRDKMMVKLHKKYPKYGFDKHKGYGTKKHFKAIKKFGPSPIHRKSFRLKIK